MENLKEDVENFPSKNLKYWSDHFAKEAEKLKLELDKFGFDKSEFMQTEKSKYYFEILADIAKKLKLNNDLSIVSYLTCLNDLYKERFKKEIIKFESNNESNKLNEKIFLLNLYEETLKKDFNKITTNILQEKEQFQNMERDFDFKQIKLEKYKSQLENFQEYLNSVDKNLMHENIKEDENFLQTLLNETKTQQAKLDLCKGLPPNIPMIKTELENISDQIKQIDDEIDTKMNLMH